MEIKTTAFNRAQLSALSSTENVSSSPNWSVWLLSRAHLTKIPKTAVKTHVTVLCDEELKKHPIVNAVLVCLLCARRWCVWTWAAVSFRRPWKWSGSWWTLIDWKWLFYLNLEIIWLFKVTLVRRWRSTLLIEVVFLFFFLQRVHLAWRGARGRSFLELNLLSAVFFMYPLVGTGEKNMFTISAVCAVDDTPFTTFWRRVNKTFTVTENNPWWWIIGLIQCFSR